MIFFVRLGHDIFAGPARFYYFLLEKRQNPWTMDMNWWWWKHHHNTPSLKKGAPLVKYSGWFCEETSVKPKISGARKPPIFPREDDDPGIFCKSHQQ